MYTNKSSGLYWRVGTSQPSIYLGVHNWHDSSGSDAVCIIQTIMFIVTSRILCTASDKRDDTVTRTTDHKIIQRNTFAKPRLRPHLMLFVQRK